MTSQGQAGVVNGPRGSLQYRCGSCGATDPGLLKCKGCYGVRYCNRDHQAEHRPKHKSICKKITQLRAELEREDHEVRNATPDFMTPANAFETDVGRFWGILSTRPYMRARFAVANELRMLGTRDGAEECLDHLLDMMRLCPGDNMGNRDLIPPLMLRLDKDQACYDFVKWYQTYDEMHYDWSNTDAPFLEVRNGDVFEEPKFKNQFLDLSFIVSMLLLKLKLLVDIRSLKSTKKILSSRLPTELWEDVEMAVVRSPLSARLVGRSLKQLEKDELGLLKQVCELISQMKKVNKSFVSILFDPDDMLTYYVGAYSPGSLETAALALQWSYAAWCETEGVLELLKDIQENASKASRE